MFNIYFDVMAYHIHLNVNEKNLGGPNVSWGGEARFFYMYDGNVSFSSSRRMICTWGAPTSVGGAKPDSIETKNLGRGVGRPTPLF